MYNNFTSDEKEQILKQLLEVKKIIKEYQIMTDLDLYRRPGEIQPDIENKKLKLDLSTDTWIAITWGSAFSSMGFLIPTLICLYHAINRDWASLYLSIICGVLSLISIKVFWWALNGLSNYRIVNNRY